MKEVHAFFNVYSKTHYRPRFKHVKEKKQKFLFFHTLTKTTTASITESTMRSSSKGETTLQGTIDRCHKLIQKKIESTEHVRPAYLLFFGFILICFR